jgi:hypothetical protein
MSLKPSAIVSAFTQLGDFLRSGPAEMEEKLLSAKAHNAWFTDRNSRRAIGAIAANFLDRENLTAWSAGYPTGNRPDERTVGVIAAGNLPLVAFHDVLCVLVAGHKLQLKLSEKDNVLMPWLLHKLTDLEPAIGGRIEVVDRLKDFDAVIATGNNNSARYFEYYFGKVPHIIRRNRNSVAVLTGEENSEDLRGLAEDVFSYFGLGCRNISKLYLPEDYDLDVLGQAFEPFREIAEHHLYRNNLDYNRTVLLMNNIPFHQIDFVNVTHNPSVASPIANLHYEYYPDAEELNRLLLFNRGQIQCIVGNMANVCRVGFGQTQWPGLGDYADDVDTMQFLSEL